MELLNGDILLIRRLELFKNGARVWKLTITVPRYCNNPACHSSKMVFLRKRKLSGRIIFSDPDMAQAVDNITHGWQYLVYPM